MGENSDPISKVAAELGEDEEFIRFLLAYHGVRPAFRVIPFVGGSITPPEEDRAVKKAIDQTAKSVGIQVLHRLINGGKVSDVERRRLRNMVKHQYGENWREIWETLKSDAKRLRRVKLRGSLFSLEPLPARPAHRPRNDPHWMAFFDILNYLTEAAQRAGRKWSSRKLIECVGRIVFPKLKLKSVVEGWSKRKRRFMNLDGKARLTHLKALYASRQEEIKEALQTGQPLSARARDPEWKLRRPGGMAPWPRWELQLPHEIWDGQCPRCRTKYTFRRCLALADLREQPVPPRGGDLTVFYCQNEFKRGVLRGIVCGRKIQLVKRPPQKAENAQSAKPTLYRIRIPEGGVKIRGDIFRPRADGTVETSDEFMAREFVRAGGELIGGTLALTKSRFVRSRKSIV